MRRCAAVYVRISKDRVGAGLGVDRQAKDCRRLAEQLGWHVAVVHSDNDLSAYSGKPRPGYRALLDDLRSRRVNGVISWHSDRLHRSPVELEEYISVCDPAGAPTHCVQAGPLDLSTPSGRLVARQLGAVARYEVEHAVERVKAAKLQAATAGKYRGGNRPFGYEPDGVTILESEAREIRAMVERLLAGDALRAIVRDLNDRKITTTRGGAWGTASLRKVVRRPRNVGLVDHHGEIVAKAEWPPLITEDKWRAVVALLDDPSRNTGASRERRYLGAGLYMCGVCGDLLRSARTGSSGKPGYRCRSGTHIVRAAEPLDRLVRDVVVARLSRSDAADLFGPDATEDLASLHTDAAAIRERLDELARLYAEGAVDARQLSQGTGRLKARLVDVESVIAGVGAGSALDGMIGIADPGAVYDDLPLSRQRRVVDALLNVTVHPGRRGVQPGGGYFDRESIEITPKGRQP